MEVRMNLKFESPIYTMYSLLKKNILVTGGAGFVGGHLVEALLQLGAHVVVADIVFDKRSYLFTEKLHKKIVIKKFNICDYKKLVNLIQNSKIDFIFHLAAQALVEEAQDNPKKTLDNNILSTINVLEATRLNRRIKGVVIASSDKAYGDLHKKKYLETDALFGDSPYEVSKSVTDLLSTSYFKTYHTPIVITRFGNIYGEGDLNYSRIIPGIMNAVAQNITIEIRSNGKYVRDYLYVKDVVNGYILLAKHIDEVVGEAFNFGSRDTLPVLEVVKKVEKAVGKKITFKILNTAKNEIPYQSLDYSKIRKAIGWKQKFSLSSTSQKIYSWYESNHLK